jgi:hypothetical protein
MGGTGTLSFGLRHPELFAGMYAIVPATNEAASTWGRGGFDALWGPVSWNLPTNEGIGVHDRLDTQQYLIDHQGGALPYTVTFHGRNDTTIEWSTQGLPWVQLRNGAQAPGPEMWANSDHSNSFDVYYRDLFSNYKMEQYKLKKNESYLVFSYAPGDDSPTGSIPSCRGSDPYAYGYLGNSVEWSSSANPFMGLSAPTDTATQFQTALRIRTDQCNWPTSGTTTVTIRRTQAFRPAAGGVITWENRTSGGTLIQSGTITLDASGRLAIPGVKVSTTGSILTLTTSSSGGTGGSTGGTGGSTGGGSTGGTTTDADHDGYSTTQGDCNDADASIYPGAAEQCDGKDNDCDGQIDDGVKTTYYRDADGDSWGGTQTTQACTQPSGYVGRGGDCNDSSAAINPGATEVADGKDNNCNGQVDENTAPPPTSSTGSITLTSTSGARDTLYRGSYDGNYGKADYLTLYNGGSPDYRSVLWFDLSTVKLPVGAVVTSVQLNLSCTSSSNVANQVYRVTRSWTEGTGTYGNTKDGATWKAYDGANLWSTAGGDYDKTTNYGSGANGIVASKTVAAGPVSFDITALAKQWLAGQVPNYGVMLTIPSNAYYVATKYSARESGDATKRPTLVINYSTP